MPWFLPIPESWKKRACRYLLQRYVGHFLKEKLSLDQLSVDLFSGRGVIKDLNLDVEALNESLDKVNAPIEIIDGYISTISMAIPWSCLLSESMEIEIKGLELTIQLKQCDDIDACLNTASMFSSMTSSLQLAEEVINSDKSASDATPDSEPFEGVQMFAQTIESVLSRVKLSLLDTIIRLEHVNNETEKGIALELRIERIDYYDDLANEQGSPVDDCEATNLSLPAEAFKNLHLMGVSLYCDEFSRTVQKTPTMEDSLDMSTRLYESTLSDVSSSTESMHQHVTFQPQSSASSETLVTHNQPIKIAVFTGKQVLKVKVKQNDSLSGPKMDVDCQIGAIHILLSPWQVHGLLYMLNNIDTQGSSKRNAKKKSARDKLMSSTDYQVVEHELQKQLQTTRLTRNQPLPEPDLNYFNQSDNLLDDSIDECEEIYFSTYGTKKSGLSEMETSTSSIKTDTTMRTNSTATTYQQSESSLPTRKKSTQKSPRDNLQKYADDPAAEMSHYRMKITFVSACILHENQSASPQDVFTPALSETDKLRQISEKFFQAVSRITFAGVNVSLKELRDQFSKILPHDHLGFLGKPFTVDCTQKVAPRHKTLSVDFIIGMAELVECLFDRKISSSSSLDEEQPRLANYCELLTFTQNDVKPTSYFSSSLHDTIPAVKLHFISGERTKSSRNSNDSRSKINVEFGQLQCEVDITIIDRLSTLLNNDTYNSSDSKPTSNLYSDYNKPYNSMLFNEAIMDEVPTDKLDITVTSQSATLCIRFPKPDLRSSTERLPWWQRNLHKEILILQLRNFKFLTQVNSGSNESNKLEFTCSDISAFFQEDCSPILIACITSDDTCDNTEKDEGFNWPRLVITSHQISSALQQDEHGDSSDSSTPHDSLNGACQFVKSDPSPFSAKKFMFQQEDLTSLSHPEPKHTCEELVLPGNEEELKQFKETASSNTKLLVEIVLPNIVAVLHSKQFFELLYNRVNNDLLLWEPMAPSPINTQEKIHHVSQGYNLNVLSPHNASDLFQMAQSGLHYISDSDSDDESVNYYSIRENKQKKQTTHSPTLQSQMCLSLNIGHGNVLANVAHQNDVKKHGEILAVIDDTVLFSVVCHNGDPYLRYLCFQANKIDLTHNGSLTEPSMSGEGALDSLRNEQTRSLNPCIRRSVRGIPSKLAGQVGLGTDSKDMLTVAVRSKLDTINNVKDYTVSVCVKGATLHHRMSDTGENWITQALDLLDVRDYPILGYIEPKVVTQLHLHLWSCSIDYRPLNLPLRSMLTADTFSISSNIVTGSQTSLLRFQLDDAALFLSDKQYMEVNIKDEYVCVADLERLELSLKTSDGKNQRYPKTDLRINTNRINIRTCSDSCSALAELIKYFATDGDLQPNHQSPADHHDDSYTTTSNTDEESYRDEDSLSLTSDVSEASSVPSDSTSKMTESCIQQVNTMMADAMRESSPSTSGSASPEREKGKREIYFVSEGNEVTRQYDASQLRETMVSQSTDSMSSSIYSDKTEKFSDDEEFCIIDDAGWGIAPKDGEPAVRRMTDEPIVIIENYIAPPIGKTDLLKQPDGFPMADNRYTLKELTVVWHMYGGKDFGVANRSKGRERRTSGDSPKPKRFNLPDFGKSLSKEEIPVIKKPSWQTRGGPGRDCDTLMELQLSKVRFQYDVYPHHTVQASRQVLIIHEVEIRDRLSNSSINKFLYQYTSESLPRQTHANMVLIKALHTRPDPNLHSQECALKVSLLPLRLNIDQDSLFFLRTFFMELSGEKPSSPYEVSTNSDQKAVNVPKGVSPPTPAPVMGVNKTQEEGPEPDELLIKFDEMTLEQDEALQAKLSEESCHSGETESQPVFIKTFIFSPDVHIKLDYHGKRLDMQQGTLAGLLAGLAQLNSSELKLRRLNYKHGLLGMDKVLAYSAHEWLTDIRRNQLPSILGGVGPMHSFVQIVHGIKDLFWLPVEQYKKDGRIVRGLQRGASSFTTSTAMALLELTNKLVLSIQYVAELTYDMLSPGPSVRQPKLKHKKFMNQRVRKGQPSDLREGVNNAYNVIKEGFGDAANNLVRAATEEQEQKGLTGVVGGVLRQIPPTIVKPVIIASEATSKVLGGMRNQLRPESKKEDEEKWKEDDK